MKFPTASLLQVGIPELPSIFSTLNKIKFRILVLTFKVIHALALSNSYILFPISFLYKLCQKQAGIFISPKHTMFFPTFTHKDSTVGNVLLLAIVILIFGSSLKTHKHTHSPKHLPLFKRKIKACSTSLSLYLFHTICVNMCGIILKTILKCFRTQEYFFTFRHCSAFS